MATQVSLTIDASTTGGFNVVPPTTFFAVLGYNGNPNIAIATFTVQPGNIATTGTFTLSPPMNPGPQFFRIAILNNPSYPFNNTTIGSTAGFISITLNDIPSSSFTNLPLTIIQNGNAQIIISFTASCLHGSSLVQLKDELKRIDQIKPGDKVLSGENLDEYIPVQDIHHCWLSLKGVEPNGQDHDAIIFEPGSLGENEPAQRLIIDPGHPMCAKKEYLEKGYEALRPAGSYWEKLKGDNVYTKKWTDEMIQEDRSRRYDLVLEEPFNVYVANGIVVRAKGYKDHRYKHFI
jgi:hypothetical protein